MTAPHDFRSIKGLSERRRLPRLGKIRLGIKQTSTKGDSPKEVDYFVVPPEVAHVYGPQPKTLNILLPSEDPLQIFPQAYKWYGQGSGLKCKGNGETALRRWADVEPATQRQLGGTHDQNDLIEIPCPCPLLKDGPCGIRAHLMVLLPDVSLSGVFQIDTTSWWNVVELNSSIDLHRGILGRIAFVPLTLRREPVEMTHDGKRRVHYLLKLAFEGNIQDALRLREQSLHNPAPIFALPAPSDDLDPAVLPDEITVEPTSQIHPTTVVRTTGEPHHQPDERPTPDATEPADTAPITHPEPGASVDASHLTAPALSEANTAHTATSPIPGTPQTSVPAPDSAQCPCGTKVSTTVATYSRKHFDGVLCFTCQRKQPSPAAPQQE